MEEWSALKSLKKRKDIVIKAADKGGALVVWRTDHYQKETLWQLSDFENYKLNYKFISLLYLHVFIQRITERLVGKGNYLI